MAVVIFRMLSRSSDQAALLWLELSYQPSSKDKYGALFFACLSSASDHPISCKQSIVSLVSKFQKGSRRIAFLSYVPTFNSMPCC
jgi:hypothetical protein